MKLGKNFVWKSTHGDFTAKMADQGENYNQSQEVKRSVSLYTDKLLKSMDGKKISIIVLLDMSKAFDSIQHDLSLKKTSQSGLFRWYTSLV